MTLKPPSRSLPKVVVKEWPVSPSTQYSIERGRLMNKALSDFTRVVEETGILDQERPQKEGSPSNESEATKSDRKPT